MKNPKWDKELDKIKRISEWSIVGNNIQDYIINDRGQKILHTQQNAIQKEKIK